MTTTTTILVLIAFAAGFIVGALVFRNNAKRITAAENKAKAVRDIITN